MAITIRLTKDEADMLDRVTREINRRRIALDEQALKPSEVLHGVLLECLERIKPDPAGEPTIVLETQLGLIE